MRKQCEGGRTCSSDCFISEALRWMIVSSSCPSSDENFTRSGVSAAMRSARVQLDKLRTHILNYMPLNIR